MGALASAIDGDRRVEGIHPAIDCALCGFPPPVAARAGRLMSALLAARVSSDAAAGWRGSPLTGDGFPLELSFCTADDRLRFTVEPGPANIEPAKRLEVALELLDRLESPRVPAGLVSLCRAMQRDRRLKYGAWIGGRVSAEGSAFKLYVEIPEEFQASELPQPRLALGDRVATARMLSYAPGRDGFEVYLRIPSLEARHVPALLGAGGLEARTREFVDLVAETYGFTIRGRLPGPSVGVSYGMGSQGTGPVSIHFFARALWGSDARIRQGFSQLAARSGWNSDTYLQASEPVAERDVWQTYHGLVGITVGTTDMSFTIGLRPVAA